MKRTSKPGTTPGTPASEATGFIPDAGRSFADAFLAAIGPRDLLGPSLRVLDVGTGTARIPIAICKRQNEIEITAVDRGSGILRRARCIVEQARLNNAIHIDQADACALPYSAGSFDAVISNGLVHHATGRRSVLCEMIRVLRPGGMLFVRDSLRQPDAATIARILSRRAAGSRENYRSVFSNVFHAALTLDDARELACAAGLPAEWVRPAGGRHWLICGWLPGVI